MALYITSDIKYIFNITLEMTEKIKNNGPRDGRLKKQERRRCVFSHSSTDTKTEKDGGLTIRPD